jgi:peptidoglycan/LPS O-acetylase OafA/YrhL
MTLPIPKTAQPQKERLVLLDLFRGIAAIAVLIYHAAKFLGVQLLPNAYLAVDMFFLLSGFVLTHNYDGKFAEGLSLKSFAVQRLIRLYPCFLLTFVIGFVLTTARMSRDMGYFDGWRLFGGAALNALFIPSYIVPYHNHAYEDTFPFNGAQWSLTFELLANWLYWVIFPYLTGRTLGLLIGAAAIAEIAIILKIGGLDVGMRPSDFLLGMPRVILPFFSGVALRRYVFDRISIRLNTAGICASVLLLLMAFSLSYIVGPAAAPMLEFAAVALLFPVLLIVACRTAPTRRVGNFCELTGNASYPVYLFQVPFFGVYAALPQLFLHMKAHDFVPYVGIAFIISTFACAVWVDRYYELPARNWLKRVWRAYGENRAGNAIPASRRLPVK